MKLFRCDRLNFQLKRVSPGYWCIRVGLSARVLRACAARTARTNSSWRIQALVSEGVLLTDGTLLPLPKLATDPFLKLWEQEVFKLLLAEGKITEETVANIRSWQHSGFSVDQSVRLEAKNTEGLQRVIE